MSAAIALTWRQYRLERRMFWRNPSAAFFNFMLPLIFLAMFGAIFAGSQTDLDVIVPGIAGMSVMTTTFVALAMNSSSCASRASSSACAARRCPAATTSRRWPLTPSRTPRSS